MSQELTNKYVGKVLPGYCNGFFGRTYTSKTVEAIGKDWVVARDDDGPYLASFESTELLIKWLDHWIAGGE